MPNPLSADIRARFEVLFAEGLTRPRNWPPFDDFSGIRLAVVTEAQAGAAPVAC